MRDWQIITICRSPYTLTQAAGLAWRAVLELVNADEARNEGLVQTIELSWQTEAVSATLIKQGICRIIVGGE